MSSYIELGYRTETIPTTPEIINIGDIETIKTIPALIKTTEGTQRMEFHRFSTYIEYPPIMVEALNLVLEQYNQAFHKVLQLRQPGAYGKAYIDGGFKNLLVQVDLRGLPFELLEKANTIPVDQLANVIRQQMFEAENSLAMYNMMRGIFSPNATERFSPESAFGVNFDSALEMYREYFDAPIVLAAVTEGKWQAMLNSEFGIEELSSDEDLNPEYVRELSGFDCFVGPKKLEQLLKRNPQVILYMRTSYPTFWLRNPAKNTPLAIPILEDDDLRRKIRDRAITPNVDDPRTVNWLIRSLSSGEFKMALDETWHFVVVPSGFEGEGEISVSIINDTKEYMVHMGFPLIVNDEQVGPFITTNTAVRLKPLFLHYGGYGHVRKPDGDISPKRRRKILHELRRNLKMRGPYIIQPEIPPYTFQDQHGRTWAAIHRLFLAYDPSEGTYKFIGGLFNALETTSHEAQQGRIHGNSRAVWGQIIVRDQNKVVNPNSLNYVAGEPATKI